jgi:hypothetical protein
MKLRYLAASLMIAVAGCADGTSGLSSTTKEAALDLPTRSTESKLVCELIVSCKDGTEVKELVSSEAECGALQEKARTFDYDQCQVSFQKEEGSTQRIKAVTSDTDV